MHNGLCANRIHSIADPMLHSHLLQPMTAYMTGSQHGIEGEFQWLAVGIIYTQRMCSLSCVTPLWSQHV